MGFSPTPIFKGYMFLWVGERLCWALSEQYLGPYLTAGGDLAPMHQMPGPWAVRLCTSGGRVSVARGTPADIKRLVLHTQIAHFLGYGIEVWRIPRGDALLDRVMLSAARLATRLCDCAVAPLSGGAVSTPISRSRTYVPFFLGMWGALHTAAIVSGYTLRTRRHGRLGRPCPPPPGPDGPAGGCTGLLVGGHSVDPEPVAGPR